MADAFSSFSSTMTSPARRAAAVTPSDADDLDNTCRSLYIGGAGNVRLTTVDGDTVTFVGLSEGTILPVVARRVLETDTTATNIVAVW